MEWGSFEGEQGVCQRWECRGAVQSGRWAAGAAGAAGAVRGSPAVVLLGLGRQRLSVLGLACLDLAGDGGHTVA